ncbi:MAG: hypothetical protein ACPGYV_14585 [Phycisphaeraceae bacterium]
MRTRIVHLAAACLGVAILAGCQTRPGYAPRDLEAMYDRDGQARSLALSAPPVRALAMTQPDADRWYDGRNDVGPFVTAGTRSVIREQSVTFTRDRQFIVNGRVFDRYDQTTFRRSISESER